MITEIPYTLNQIGADLTFLKFIIKKNKISLKGESGLNKLIGECEELFLDNSINNDKLKTITVLNILVHSLKILWMNDKNFRNQLASMNRGSYQYGQSDTKFEYFFKDFEFELFSASELIRKGLSFDLPQNDDGEDLIFNNFDIQCKHPNTLNQIEGLLRAFTYRLNKTKRFGVFGIGVEDCFGFADRLMFESSEDFNEYFTDKSENAEASLIEILQNQLANSTRVIGLYTTASFFVNIDGIGLKMIRLANSVFCFRPDRKDIKEYIYKEGFKIVSAFNNSPTWLTIEKQKLKAINGTEINND